MIGKNTIIIDMQEIATRGMSSSGNISDGAFSDETSAINPLIEQGVLYAPPTPVDADTDTRLTGGIIASSPDMNVLAPTNRLIVADNGTAYRYNGTNLTAAAINLTVSETWTKGLTDIIIFEGEAYVSSRAKLTRWENNNTIDAGASWPYAFSSGTSPHVGLVYEKSMYWSDKNVLLKQDTVGDGVAPTTVLTLSADQVITALGIDPGSGRMLIATSTALDVSNTLAKVNRLSWYDGNSTKPDKVVIIEDMITAFHTVGGTIFVGYGQNLGYINGSGISFLRKLKNVSLNNEQLPYKHNMASNNNILYVLDGLQVLAYGEVITGRKIFWYAFKNNANTNKPTALFFAGSNKLGIAYATTKFVTIDISSSAIDGFGTTFVSNVYNFPRPIFLRSAYMEFTTAIANADANRELAYKTQARGTGFQSLTPTTNSSGGAVYELDNIIGFENNKCNSVQFRYQSFSSVNGLRRIRISYDVAE